jgi:hypothetical protein
MIEMDEKLVGIWFLATIPNSQDWMAGVRELEPDQKYKLTYRFRYYKDDKAFDSEDKRNWYEGTVTGTRAYVIASLRSVAKKLAEMSTEPLYEVLNEHGLDQFMRDFQDQPFVYMKIMGASEK